MNLQDIQAFIALAETGSINRAALRLHLTQPATTRRVQNFESALGGAALLDRRAKPPILTPAGRQALEHCRRILKAVAELEASVRHGEPTGDLRVGIAHGLGEVVLGTPLDGLRRRLPGVRLQISSNWTRQLIEDVRAGALDCAIGLVTDEHAVPPGLQVTPLGPESVVVVAARDAVLPGKSGRPRRLRDLAGADWILNPPGCGCRAALQRAFDRAQAPMRVIAEVFGEELQLSMIVRGAALGLVPLRQLKHSPHRARLQSVEVGDFTLRATIAVLHGAALGTLAPAVEQLETQIAARLKKLA
jgi:DNA-binding transcriptional LysR family regulator